MGDKMDKEGNEALTKDVEVERSEVTPPVDGLRRSRRLRNLPPPPAQRRSSEVGGSSSRKRPAPPEQENGPKKKVTAGDDVSAKVNVANRAGKEETSPEPKVEVKGVTAKRGEAPASGPPEQETGAKKIVTAGDDVSTKAIVAKREGTERKEKVVKTDDEPRLEVEGLTAKRIEPSASSLSSRGDAAVGAGNSETQSSQEKDAHPCLFIDTILDVVFNHIINRPGTGQDQEDHVRKDTRKRVQQDVRNIRQVCKTWKTSITRLYRQTGSTATFDDYNYVKRKQQPNLTQFLNTMRPSEMIPVQNYNFLNSTVLGPNGEPELFREFLVMCGPEARSLDLSIRSCESERIMSDLMDLPDLDLGKLTRLNLTIFENHQVTYQADRIPGNVKLLELLLTAAKGLREFELSYPPLRHNNMPIRVQEVTLIQQLIPAIVKRLPASVKQFTLRVEMNESGFDALAGIQSQLEIFGLDVDFPLGSKTIFKFLQSQATTLQRLHLWGCINGSVVDFPRLHELAELEMSCANVSTTAHLEFAEIFPKLQCLKIGKKHLHPFLTLLSRAQKPLAYLKVLHLPTWSRYHVPGSLKDIVKYFPCLAELRVGLWGVTTKMMGDLFTYFDNLELLNITEFSPPDCVDSMSMFSGIAISECSRIEEAQDFEKENMTELRRGLSLLNLTRLKKLVVGKECHLLFTDFCAHFVFLEMGSLRELHLRKSGTKFSPKYRDLLEAKLDKLILFED